jgi:hypothetical protein
LTLIGWGLLGSAVYLLYLSAKFASAGRLKSWYTLAQSSGSRHEVVFTEVNAGIAQLVEQLICNQQVVGSNPTAGSFAICDCGLLIGE